jgi:catechol 2,3-dioxygenase-like lactoylglutathione lyase family enzyme
MSVLLGLLICVFGIAGPVAADTWDHIHFTVSDTKAAADWYAKHFDGKVGKSGPFDAVWFGSNMIKFRGGEDLKGSDGSRVDHIGFSVKDVEAKAEALGADGATVAAANRRKQGVRYATDPWGTKIELMTDEDLLGFHHFLIKTTRPYGTLEFYTSMFGGEVSKFKDVMGVQAIRYNDMYVFVQRAVRPPGSAKGNVVDHLGWRFKDFDAAIKKLKAADVKFVVEPRTSGDHKMAFIESPNGVKIEIVEDVGH